MERWREGRWGGNVAEEGVCTPAEGPSLQHGAAPPHPGSHAHLDCKRQVMGAPGSPQSWPCGEENQRPGCMCNLGQQPRAEWDPGAGMLHPKGSRCWQGGERREPGAVPVGHCPPRGRKAGGPPPRAAVRPSASLPARSVSPKSLCQLRCLVRSSAIAPTWLREALGTPKRAAPQAAGSSWLPGALGAQVHCPGEHLTLDNQPSQAMQDQGERVTRGLGWA